MKAGLVILAVGAVSVLLALFAALRGVSPGSLRVTLWAIGALLVGSLLFAAIRAARDVPRVAVAETQRRILVVVAVALMYAALCLRLLL